MRFETLQLQANEATLAYFACLQLSVYHSKLITSNGKAFQMLSLRCFIFLSLKSPVVTLAELRPLQFVSLPGCGKLIMRAGVR